MIPEGLAGELVGGCGDESREGGRAIPVGETQFAGGMDSAIDGGEQQILPDGEALTAFGQMPIKKVNETDALGEIVEGDDIAERGDFNGLRLRDLSLLLLK